MGIKRCRLGKRQQLRLLECFVLEVTARSAADMLGMQANTTMLFYRKVRHLIAGKLAETFPEHGEFEVDESYFGGVRKGKRGRGAAGKRLAEDLKAEVQKNRKARHRFRQRASEFDLLFRCRKGFIPECGVYAVRVTIVDARAKSSGSVR